MSASLIFSTAQQLEELMKLLFRYTRLPFFTGTVPGAVMEAALARVRGGDVLPTYDFVDVINPNQRLGWQVKSTKADTPVTWKRAKIPNKEALIAASFKSEEGEQRLGDAIINFCNDHVEESFRIYGLSQIGYSRLIIFDNGEVRYFEKFLCSHDQTRLFNPADFVWKWSTPKKTTKKEQLQALHGRHKTTGEKWWAWHGLGENQLHFPGERTWWPEPESLHTVTFHLPEEGDKIDLDKFMEVLARLDEVTEES